ncbi:MAG: ORF6N domain-containing protein [Saprospiraceae bacterium]|nr:ORF6N domain-containing protein [Saprospiraceae bacterium]
MMELQHIRQKIFVIRGQRVMLDFELAVMYGVETRALKQAVRRNSARFPEDFMFILSENEADHLVSQIVIPSKSYLGGALPYAFTEQGVAMLSSVLRSEKAIQVNIAIMRAFVEFRRYAFTYGELAQKIVELETKFEREFADIHEVLKWLGEENQSRADEIVALQNTHLEPNDWQNRPRIGFRNDT